MQAQVFLLLFAIGFVINSGCQSDPFKTTCYEVERERMGRTTKIFVSVTTDENQAYGEQSTTVIDESGKVIANAVGTFKGTCLNGTCLVDYNYKSEGESRVAEEEFKTEGDVLLMTAGSYRLEDGKEFLKERGLFNLKLEKINCP